MRGEQSWRKTSGVIECFCGLKDMFLALSSNRDRKVAANETAAKKLAEDIRTRNLGKELIASRIKMECWDSMEVQKKEVGNHAAEITFSFVATSRCRACECRLPHLDDKMIFGIVRASSCEGLGTTSSLKI